MRRSVAAAEAAPASGEALGELGRVYHAHQYYELARQCYLGAQRLAPDTFDWP